MTKNMLFLSLAAAAFAANLNAAAAQGVPTLDVNTLCRAEAKAASEFSQNCLGDQKQAHEELVKQWATFSPKSRAECMSVVNSIPGMQSYVELLTCLQIKRDVTTLPKE